jgi:transcription termination factor Rho
MAIGESKPNPESSSKLSSDDKSVPADTFIDISNYQKLDGRQLDALLSQHKLSVDKSSSSEVKIRAVLDHHLQIGDKLVGVGTLQILPDGFGFLRSRWFNYLGGPDDIYVSPSQIRKFDLANGDVVKGQVRPPKDNERFFALLRVFKVNEQDPAEASKIPEFDGLAPLSPNVSIPLDSDNANSTCRIVDMIAPIGFGQRGIIASPPRSGKTKLIQALCEEMLANDSKAHVFILLVDQRPEEIGEMEELLESDRCEVISSVFDETTFRHHDVAMMVLEKAKRMVETGVDVVVFIDSLTSLARFELGHSYSKTYLESTALPKTKSFLASARRTNDAGTLTILGTVKVESGNELDDSIAEVLRGTANMEIQLDRELVQRRIWPAINIHLSQCQQEEVLLDDLYDSVCKLRRSLGDLSVAEAMEKLLAQIDKTESNRDLLGGM